MSPPVHHQEAFFSELCTGTSVEVGSRLGRCLHYQSMRATWGVRGNILRVPRLNQHDYLQHRAWLIQLLQEKGEALAGLSVRDQQDLHQFFLTDKLDYSEVELTEHRRAISRMDESLPNRAGKALRRLQASLGVVRPQRPARGTGAIRRAVRSRKRGPVVVTPIMRATPDIGLLAEAVIRIAEDIGSKDQAVDSLPSPSQFSRRSRQIDKLIVLPKRSRLAIVDDHTAQEWKLFKGFVGSLSRQQLERMFEVLHLELPTTYGPRNEACVIRLSQVSWKELVGGAIETIV